MALKMDRDIVITEAGFTMNEAAAPGGIVVVSTGTASGTAIDQDTQAVVTYAANPSGKYPVGLLLSTMTDTDPTKYPLNYYKQELPLGSKVSIVRKGYVVTDKIVGTPATGHTAYLNCSGCIGTTNGGNDINLPAVGKFGSVKDASGFVKVIVDL